MQETNNSAEEWLSREDSVTRDDRVARLNSLIRQMPKAEYLTFPGGMIAKSLFEEARYCFVYGQFLATIVLGLSYIEHTLAALFYASGRNDLERASMSILLREALSEGWISQDEFENLDHAREVRNPITHFRKPLHSDTVEYQAVNQNELPYTIIEADARHVMETALHIVDKHAI
jgi:hypothetical protein